MAATCPHTGLVVCDSRRSLLTIKEPRDPISGSLRCFDAVFILLLPYIGGLVCDVACSLVLRSCMRALP